jgi:hypothetical protein
MSKEARPRHQLNLRFTGESKAKLLQNLDDYLEQYKITKADFVAIAIQYAIDNDLASMAPTMIEKEGVQIRIQGMIDESVAPLLEQIEELKLRLVKSKPQSSRNRTVKATSKANRTNG